MSEGAPPRPAPLVHTPAWDEALSALADGEATGFDRRIVEDHLERCARCRAINAANTASAATASFVPDGFAGHMARAVAEDDRAGVRVVLRLALAVIGGILLAGAIPDLIAGHEGGMAVHAARHLGSFTAAYGAGLLVVSVRPARARTMLPVSMVLGVALLITAVVDVLDGHIPLVGETRHLPELASVAVLFALARTHAGSRRSVAG